MKAFKKHALKTSRTPKCVESAVLKQKMEGASPEADFNHSQQTHLQSSKSVSRVIILNILFHSSCLLQTRTFARDAKVLLWFCTKCSKRKHKCVWHDGLKTIKFVT